MTICKLTVPSVHSTGSRPHSQGYRTFLKTVFLSIVCGMLASAVLAQDVLRDTGSAQGEADPINEELSSSAVKVDVSPAANDDEIRKRLQSTLDAIEWFVEPHVRVEGGVVFLSGKVESDELKRWAGDLARNTQDVVAVVNRMQLLTRSVWDFSEARLGMQTLARDVVNTIPAIILALIILALTVGAATLTTRGVLAVLLPRVRTHLLRRIIARTAGGFVILGGVYLILRVSGLTQLALTVVGGTGLIGLIVGIAFRDITENFLASIFLSIKPPFETGDLVEIGGVTGYVQQLNKRTTILMTLDGNIVQIPNTSIYKSVLSNFTTNANRRESFVVGIGYNDAIDEAQELARQVLAQHPAVLEHPEPSVLAESLGTSTVNLRVYFWFNGREYSWLKVRSSVIRLVKRAFQENGISMPDEAREIVFPEGIPVTMLEKKPAEREKDAQRRRVSAEPWYEGADVASTKAEAGLYSEAVLIGEQAQQAHPLKEGENLLIPDPRNDIRADGNK
ncbi:MAG: mechanosensitive ion channel family protein [Spongiibacteraceae bacterium]|jgi:small-conductance mechanosensitive channel|nr:mechanosensitive ion channel family protein [Spongiibacteraceae bacterium]